MDCANCKNPMITAELNNVEIDICSGCGGIWLDAGELENLLADETQARQIMASFTPAANCPESPQKCPICGKNMDKINTGTGSDITLLDCCPDHGLWFDRQELRHVLENAVIDQNGKIIKILKEMFPDTDQKPEDKWKGDK